MAHRSTLVAVSAVQLVAQVVGHVVAVRRQRAFDVPFMTGDPAHLVRDWLWFGTAYSAPPYLLGPQIWAVATLLRGPDDRARWVLRWLGTGLTVGYASERWNRVRVRPTGFDPVETPVVVAGWSCALAMAVLARRTCGGPGTGCIRRCGRPRRR
jgi:hypothetical protein